MFSEWWILFEIPAGGPMTFGGCWAAGGCSLSGVGFFLVPKLMEDSERGNRERKAGVDGVGGVAAVVTTWTGRWWTEDWTMGLNMCIDGIYQGTEGGRRVVRHMSMRVKERER